MGTILRIGKWRKLDIRVGSGYIKCSSYHMDTHSNNSMKWATGGLDPPPLRMGLGMAYAGLYLEAGGGKEISHAIEGRLSLG